jgi:hypothetical protein
MAGRIAETLIADSCREQLSRAIRLAAHRGSSAFWGGAPGTKRYLVLSVAILLRNDFREHQRVGRFSSK